MVAQQRRKMFAKGCTFLLLTCQSALFAASVEVQMPPGQPGPQQHHGHPSEFQRNHHGQGQAGFQQPHGYPAQNYQAPQAEVHYPHGEPHPGRYFHEGRYYKYRHEGRHYNYFHNGHYYNYFHNGGYYNYFVNGEYFVYLINGAYYNYFYNGVYYKYCKNVPGHWFQGEWFPPTQVCH